jgi:hypothetical protein
MTQEDLRFWVKVVVQDLTAMNSPQHTMPGTHDAMEKAMNGLSKAGLNIFQWPRRSCRDC